MSLPIPDKKKKVPSFDEVMKGYYQPPKVPSYDEIMGMGSKKKGSVDLEGSSLEAGNSLSQSNGEVGTGIPTVEMYTTPSGEMVEANPIALSKKFNELSNRKKEVSQIGGATMGTTSTLVDDENAQKEAKKLREDFPDIDFEGISNEISGISDDTLSSVGKELMADRKENYPLYQRKIADLKWREGLHDALFKSNIPKEEYDRVVHLSNQLTEATGNGDFRNQREAIKSLAQDIQMYGGENKENILKNFAIEVSKVYGNPDNKPADLFKDSPESKYLNNDEQLALQYLKDVAPEKAQQYDRLNIDPKTIKDNPDAVRAVNHLHETLEETSIGLQQNAVTEELNSLKNIAKKNNGLSETELNRAKELEKKNEELSQKRNELDSKYPDRIPDKAADAVNEVMGKDINWLEYAAVKTGQAFKNTGEGIWEAVSTPFMSDASNQLRELSLMGESITDEKNLKQPDRNKALLTDKMVIKPELQTQVDAIKNNAVLTDEQKRSKLFSLFYTNPDKFGRVPIQDGKFNISPSSILYGLTDLGTSLIPFVALETVTGGGATAGAARKFLSTFTAAAATTFHDEYANAVMQGKSQSDAYKSAMASTAITSFAMAGASTPTELRAMAKGNSSAEKIIQGMSDKAIQDVLDKGTPKGLTKLKQAFVDRAKATPEMISGGLKTGAKFEAYMAGANELNGKEQNFKQSLLNIANFGIMGAGLGHVGYKSPTELQKGSIVEFGKNPDAFRSELDDMKKNGMSQSEYDHRKMLIDKSEEAYKTLPKANAKGQPLTEKEKGEYMYNTVIKNEGKKAASTLPPKQAEKAEMTAMVADHANDIILDSPTDKQLQDRKDKLEKALIPEKDADGKNIEIPEKELLNTKAELQAVNDELDTRKSFQKVEIPRKDITPKEQPTVSETEGKSDVVGELKITDKTKDILDEVSDDKIGEKKYQDFSIDFEDGARAYGKIEDGVADISGINAPKNNGEVVRGSKTYERVLSKLKESGVKTVNIKLQSNDSEAAIKKLVDNGFLTNPRNIMGSSGNEHPVTFDIGSKVNFIEKKNTGTEIEPELGDGRNPVTLSGSTEAERQVAIEQRKKETKQTPMTEARDKLLERIQKYNNLTRPQKRQAYIEANKIKLAVDFFNKEHDQKHSLTTNRDGSLELRNNPTEKRASGKPIKNTLKGNENAIVDNGKPLMERGDNTKKVFNDLLDADVLPVSRRINGEKMSEAEHEATIQDIMDGIPSQRAENYLNSLEKQIKEDNFDFGNPDKNARTTLNDALNITVEKGEPMTPESIEKWLSNESELTPEEQTTFDNIDNLITHYEQLHESENGTPAKVQQPAGKGQESNSGKANENGQPKSESSTANKKEPIKNEEDQATKISKPTTETGDTAPPNGKSIPKAETGEKVGKFEEKARKLADKIKASETPSWLKIDDPNVKKKGIGEDDIKEALANATIKMGKLLDKGVEFGEAVKEAVKDLVDLMGEGMRDKIENGFRDDYNKGLGEFAKTGVKKEVTNETRAANGMPKVTFPKMSSDVEALNAAKERVDSGKVNPQEMVDRINKEKTNYKNEDEVMDMQYYAHQLQKRNTELNEQLADAETPEQKLDIVNQKMQLSDLIDAQTEAAQTAGNQWGKTGNRMQPVINDAGQIFRENKNLIKEAYGGEVPKEVQAKLDALTKERDDALAAKAKVEEQLKQKMAEKGFEEMKKRAAKSSKTKETAEALKKEEQDLLQQLKDAGKSDPNAPKRSGAAITDRHVVIIVS